MVIMKKLAFIGIFLVSISALSLLITGCGKSSTTSPVLYSVPELEYRLLSQYSDFFWCDPDVYPIAREGQEQSNAVEQFPAIETNTAEFVAIISHLGLLQKTDYTDAEKLEIYREYKKLTYAVQVTGSGSPYNFTIRIGKGQGELIEGTITTSGEIKETSREPSINTCPICLVKGTLIDTPVGPVPIEKLEKGMAVWTVDVSRNRVPAIVVTTSSTPVPPAFRVVKVVLDDGRSVTASSGHPATDGRPLGDIKRGDILDGSTVVSSGPVAYDGGATYDLLPAGETGFYFANGILLKSTLSPNIDLLLPQ
jgi:hypothetical protein